MVRACRAVRAVGVALSFVNSDRAITAFSWRAGYRADDIKRRRYSPVAARLHDRCVGCSADSAGFSLDTHAFFKALVIAAGSVISECITIRTFARGYWEEMPSRGLRAVGRCADGREVFLRLLLKDSSSGKRRSDAGHGAHV